jgi:hypothetical protein
MKAFYLITICCINISSCTNKDSTSQKADSLNVNSKIGKNGKATINYNTFVGKNIEQFLNSMPRSYDKYICFSEPPGILAGVSFYYGDTLIVRINTDHTVLNIKDDFNWAIGDLKNEKISKIQIINNNGAN